MAPPTNRQSRRRVKQASNGTVEIAEAKENDKAVQEQPTAIVIRVIRDGTRINTLIEGVGDIRPTEFDTIIRLALKQFRDSNGIE